MPVAFIGHGNPMNAIIPNRFADAWAALGEELPRPKAVLCVSAHWFGSGLAVTAMPQPRTIHDFGGFPPQLFAMQYPAPGLPELARRVVDLIGRSAIGEGLGTGVSGEPPVATLDTRWGLDHGTWSVLCRMYPPADIPVVQLSLDARRPARFHLELGAALAPLRDEGVLIMGSGNVVHNLSLVRFGDDAPPFEWAQRFESAVRGLIASGNGPALADTERLGPDAQLAIPTPEHYLPLLYVMGAAGPDDEVRFPVDGIEASSLSMLSAVLG